MKRFLACSALALFSAAVPAAAVFDMNLIVNGDAESGTHGWSGYDIYAPIQSVAYGNNWVRFDQPGPTHRGARMFTGTGGYAVGQQAYDFGDATATPLSFTLSGWLGGWAAQGDNALFYAQFLDASGSELGSATIGPVTPSERRNATGLYLREQFGWMPAGTTQVSFWLSMERQGGGDNDGYADNLSFTLHAPAAVPEPAPLLLMGAATLWLMGRRRR